jgi:hypothetical protein
MIQLLSINRNASLPIPPPPGVTWFWQADPQLQEAGRDFSIPFITRLVRPATALWMIRVRAKGLKKALPTAFDPRLIKTCRPAAILTIMRPLRRSRPGSRYCLGHRSRRYHLPKLFLLVGFVPD